MGEFTIHGFSTVVISSVAASVIGRIALGDIPAFIIPMEYEIFSLWEYIFFPILGVLVTLFGILYIRSICFADDLFGKWKRVPEWFKPAVGGALLGVFAFAYTALSHLAGHPLGTRNVQLQVPQNTSMRGKCLAELNFPEEFLVIHVQREGRNILPHGDTCLEPGDIITFLVKEDDINSIESFWLKNQQIDS